MSHADREPGRKEVARCPRYEAGKRGKKVDVDAIDEASGLVASHRQPGVLWVHNDSGDDPRIFAITVEGRGLGIFEVQGAKARDWEDIDIGPGPVAGRDYLYVGDIGDNRAEYPDIVVYRIPEPDVGATGGAKRQLTEPAESLRLTYPDHPHDAEALLVDPRDGSVVIVTKERQGPALVFQTPERSFEVGKAKLARVAELPMPRALLPGSNLVTAGSVSRDGGWVLLKTYTATYLWERRDGPLWGAFRDQACPAPTAFEPQGEAASFVGDGLDFVTLSEGRDQPVYVFATQAASDSTRP